MGTASTAPVGDTPTGDVSRRPQYFRPLDFQKRPGRRDLYLRDDGYAGQLVHQGNQSVIIATSVPPRLMGIPTHRHPVDQIFVIAEGELTIKIEGVDHKIPAGGAILVPAGMGHETRNDADVPATYLEVLTPAPTFFSGIVLTEGAAFEMAKDARPIVTPPGELAPTFQYTVKDGRKPMQWRVLMDQEKGCKSAMIYHAQNAIGGGGPNLHFHVFDQFFFVLKGELTVQIGLEKYHAEPHTLVILPAGVPHTQWNEGNALEQHFAILTPPPTPGDLDPPDVWVNYERLEGVD